MIQLSKGLDMPQFIGREQDSEQNQQTPEPEISIHLVIEQDFPLLSVSQEDMQFLSNMSVWTKEAGKEPGDVNIIGQKIVLPHKQMEEVFEILSYYGKYMYSLYRYDYARYQLKADLPKEVPIQEY